MKSLEKIRANEYNPSHPTRGAWIEIFPVIVSSCSSSGRTPHGVRGLKFPGALCHTHKLHVAPHTGCVD